MLENTVEYKRFVWEFRNILQQNNLGQKIIFLCIGTTKIIGDSFGPAVGTILKKSFYGNDKVEVIGNLKNALTYDEIEENMDFIKQICINKLIIVLDSALSNENDVGKIFIQNRGLRYAESLKKQNKIIGNISIKAVVGEDTNEVIDNFNNLKNASFQKIKFMSNIVSNGIIDVMNKKENIGKNIYK